MPAEGYRTITVSEELYDILKKHAKKTHRSLSKFIEHLVEKAEEANFLD